MKLQQWREIYSANAETSANVTASLTPLGGDNSFTWKARTIVNQSLATEWFVNVAEIVIRPSYF